MLWKRPDIAITSCITEATFNATCHFCPVQVLTEKRRLGSRDGPPHLVAVVALHAGVDAEAVTRLLRCEGAGGLVREESSVCGVSDSFGLVMPRFKQRFTFLRPDTGNSPTWIL